MMSVHLPRMAIGAHFAPAEERLMGPIKQFWLESGGVYGYRKITDDLRDVGETCGKHRVHRLMPSEGLRSQTGYRRRPGHRHGRSSVVCVFRANVTADFAKA
jgi:putative transposase